MGLAAEPESQRDCLEADLSSQPNGSLRASAQRDSFYTKGDVWSWTEQGTVPYDASYIETFYRHVEAGTDRRTNGVPTDIEGATALFNRNPFDFERWAVSLVDGEPNQKQVADQGVNGRIRFDAGSAAVGVAVVSVKGGQNINPAMVQSLVGATQQ